MDYSGLIKNRRSIRLYKDQPVSTDLLKEIVEESTLAPSSGNSQLWKFVIVNNREVMKRISDEGKRTILARIRENPDDYAVKYEKTLSNEDYNVFYNAPALIIVAGPKDYKNLMVDCALCAGYIMNAAVSRGLGTCWINFASDLRDAALLDELGLTPDLKIVAPLIIGYPQNIPAVPARQQPAILKVIN